MENKNTQLLIGICLLLAALAGNYLYLSSSRDQYQPKNLKEIVRVKAPISPGTPITLANLEKAVVPEKFLPKASIPWSEREGYNGLQPNVQIAKDDYLLQTYFSSKIALGNTLSKQLDGTGEYMRAINLAVDETNSMARSIVAGDHIDIILTFTPNATTLKMSTVLLQNVPVIATGTFAAADQEIEGGDIKRYNSLTLRLNAQDAARLNYARQQGKISITLRGSADTSSVVIKPITNINDILSAQDREEIEKIVEKNKPLNSDADKFKEQVRDIFEQQRKQSFSK